MPQWLWGGRHSCLSLLAWAVKNACPTRGIRGIISAAPGMPAGTPAAIIAIHHGVRGMSDTLGIALVGCGTVGGGVADILLHHTDRLGRRAGRPLALLRVVVRDL